MRNPAVLMCKQHLYQFSIVKPVWCVEPFAFFPPVGPEICHSNRMRSPTLRQQVAQGPAIVFNFSDPIACATPHFPAMPWVQCTCGLSVWGGTDKFCKAQLQRHERDHVVDGDLELDTGPSTRDTCLFAIMSHRHNHGAHTGCKIWLKT